MLSLVKVRPGSWRYYQEQVAHGLEYYTAGELEAPGVWYGRGLQPLNLLPGGQVAERELEAMFTRALHPTSGERLGHGWRGDGVTGFDLCFSAPKSVSALWALGDEPVQAAVRAAHTAAVRAALDYFDEHAALSRRGRNGVEQLATGGFAAACFDHRTSRAGDPQLHTHALAVNKLLCADGKWRTVDGHEVYHHKKSAGVVYQAALRAELTCRLGVGWGPVSANGQAEIAGMPAELLTAWSKRAADVEAEVAPKIAEYEASLGRKLTAAERARVIKTAVLKTRPAKTHDDPISLHGRWRAEAEALGWTPQRLLDAVQAAARTQQPVVVSVDQLLAQAVNAAGRRRAVFSRADLAAEVAARLPAGGHTAAQVRRLVEELTDAALAHPDAVVLGAVPDGATARASDARYASRELLAAEARVLAFADAGRSAGLAEVDQPTVEHTVTAPQLDADQRTAVLRLTTGGAFLEVLAAPAGAGKTTTLGVAARAWDRAGVTVLGLAPTARAAAELAAATGGPADTLAKWAHEHGQGNGWLAPNLVVLVDEASRADTFTLEALLSAARQACAKVVLVGDPAQPGVIDGPGGLLALLAQRGHGVELTGVRRFTNRWEREVSLQLRSGDPDAVIRYAEHDRIHPTASREQALDAVFTRWAQALAAGCDALMLTASNADADALNLRARAAAQAAGHITGPAVRLGGRDWQAGDLLRARRNNRRLPVGESHVRNGDRYTVVAVTVEGLVVDDLAGRGRTLLPADYVARHAGYGWASTIDAAQGATTDVGVLLAHPGLDREHLYVGMTRGRSENHVHVDVTPADAEVHHLPARQYVSLPDAIAVLVAAQARVGAEQAAHTLAARAAARPAVEVPTPVRAPTPEERDQAKRRLADLTTIQRYAADEHRAAAREVDRLTRQLADATGWRRRDQRRRLTEWLGPAQARRNTVATRLHRIDAELEQVTALLDQPVGYRWPAVPAAYPQPAPEPQPEAAPEPADRDAMMRELDPNIKRITATIERGALASWPSLAPTPDPSPYPHLYTEPDRDHHRGMGMGR